MHFYYFGKKKTTESCFHKIAEKKVTLCLHQTLWSLVLLLKLTVSANEFIAISRLLKLPKPSCETAHEMDYMMKYWGYELHNNFWPAMSHDFLQGKFSTSRAC